MAVLGKRILAAALAAGIMFLFTACTAAGWTDAEIDDVLQAEIPPDAYFNARGIYGNYHGGGNVLFEDPDILQWIVSKSR